MGLLKIGEWLGKGMNFLAGLSPEVKKRLAVGVGVLVIVLIAVVYHLLKVNSVREEMKDERDAYWKAWIASSPTVTTTSRTEIKKPPVKGAVTVKPHTATESEEARAAREAEVERLKLESADRDSIIARMAREIDYQLKPKDATIMDEDLGGFLWMKFNPKPLRLAGTETFDYIIPQPSSFVDSIKTDRIVLLPDERSFYERPEFYVPVLVGIGVAIDYWLLEPVRHK